MYEYQEEGIRFLVERKRAILADQPGLGKTRQVLLALAELRANTVLVLSPKSAIGVWVAESERWIPYAAHAIAYEGTPYERKRLWDTFQTLTRETQAPMVILVTTYAMIPEVSSLRPYWDAIVCDEYQLSGLVNRKTKRFAWIKALSSRYLFFLSGTPILHGPHDLWPLLNRIDPQRFNSFWNFVRDYCIVSKTPFGLKIEGRPKNIQQFKELIRPYLLRRKKEQVYTQLPPKIRQAIPLTMTPTQRRLYEQLENELVADLGDGRILATPTKLAQITRLRQVLVTPQLLGHAEEGAALQTLPELVREEFDAGRAVAVFTPFRQAIPYIWKAISSSVPRVTPMIVHGGMSGRDIARAVSRFQRFPGKKVLISTIKGATAYTAHAASVAFFVGFEWSLNDNEQAEDRLHRVGQTQSVHIKYLLHKGTVEDDMIEVLSGKKLWSEMILDPETVLRKLRERAATAKKS